MADGVNRLDLQLSRITDRLTRDYAGAVPDDVIRLRVREAVEEIGETRVTQFVPVLVERIVRDRLPETAARHGSNR